MMGGNELQRVYQAWQQGNEYYIRDWFYFAQWAANLNKVTTDVMLQELQKYKWFEKE